jgi:hypothetical protein
VSLGAQVISKADSAAELGGQWEVGLYPLQLIEERVTREFDVGFWLSIELRW